MSAGSEIGTAETSNEARSASGSVVERIIELLNGRYHKVALWVFMVVVLAHWAEHLVQGLQVYVLGWARPDARGVLGMPFPWLVSSEWLHFAYAVFMLIGLLLLRPGFRGSSRLWWDIAIWIQVWHFFEHLLLWSQAMVGRNILGKEVPTSALQLLLPSMRVELHLFYNAAVTIPMVVAMVLHRHPPEKDRALGIRCTCEVQADGRRLAA